MPAKDIYHDTVKNALVKDGWTITHDPLTIQFGGVDFYVDLGAERMMAAEKNGQQIAVETKSFTTHSLLGSDAMWVITETLADGHFGQTSEVFETSEV